MRASLWAPGLRGHSQQTLIRAYCRGPQKPAEAAGRDEGKRNKREGEIQPRGSPTGHLAFSPTSVILPAGRG